MNEQFLGAIENFSVGLAIAGVVATLFAALRSGAIKKLVVGPFTFEGSEEVAQTRALIAAVTSKPAENVPFETEQLARYYAQVLAQSKISFWFSLLFASLGFLVIVVAAFTYSTERVGSTVASISAGAIIDAVAALFFVQSKDASRALAEFFDKLRRDRQQAESRALCESVSNPDARDALRIQLALYYAGIDNSHMVGGELITGAFGNRPSKDSPTK